MGIKTAVVILNWNGKKFLEKFLPSVVLNSPGALICVADNASTDDSVSFVLSNFPGVRIIRNDLNYGFAGGYNHCLRELDAEYFVLLNSDVEVAPGWIEPVISLMERDAFVGICQPKIKAFNAKDHFEYAGASGGFIDCLGYPFCRGRLFAKLEEDNGQYNDAIEVFWATGACMFIRSSVFRELRGFDETFFAHMEEIDLCWRARRFGYKVMVQPASVVYHLGGGTLDKSNPAKTYLNFRNNILMLHKNLPASLFCIVLPFRLVLDGIAGLRFLAGSGIGDCFAVVRAHFYFYMNFIQRVRIRKESRPGKPEPLMHGIYKGSVVFDHYIKGVGKFSGLKKNKFT